jgi:apolipoprotein N-acyltransferase
MLLALLSGVLLDIPFPIAGPLPVWRSLFAWFALVPLLFAMLLPTSVQAPRYLWRSALAAYAGGVLWYVLNCYWIYQTMHIYGSVGAAGSVGILILYSLVLGLYFGVFGLVIALLRKSSGGNRWPLAMAPFVWVGLEFAASRITSVPWDQLGYSQVDNFLLTRLAPWTGVYGISVVLMAGNAVFAAASLSKPGQIRLRLVLGGAILALGLQMGSYVVPRPAPTQATAVLLQENLSVNEDHLWVGQDWDDNTGAFRGLSLRTCGPYYIGVPGPMAQVVTPQCPATPTLPNLIAWPEAPAPFRERDERFHALMSALAKEVHAPVIAGNIGSDREVNTYVDYNSAEFVTPDGDFLGRYDKIHLVPFGEYVPYQNLLFFAHSLTAQITPWGRGKYRKVFTSQGHRFGIFICYESVFADEIRHFAENGAQVFVNISDDGWYGDTSAPWQHLNMARMRAIENHRWIVRATNTGVTAAIDPQGRVTQSAPRHVLTSLAVRYGYRDDTTFYTEHGDLFATLCAIIAIVATAKATRVAVRRAPTRRQVLKA